MVVIFDPPYCRIVVWKRCLAEIRVYDIINVNPAAAPGLRGKSNRSEAGEKKAPPPDFARGGAVIARFRFRRSSYCPCRAAREGDGAAGLGEVQGATGKTANANRKIVNAARVPSPKRAQMYLATGSS